MSRPPEHILTSPMSPQPYADLRSLADRLSKHELMWASGFLAGQAQQADAAFPSTPQAEETASLAVLYATETGNSRRIADQLVQSIIANGQNARALDVRDVKTSRLKKMRHVVFVAATHGLGDAPDGTEDFFDDLMSDRAPKLDHLSFSVLALGDSSYDDFCQVGIDLDARLEALGATRFAPRVDCDLDFDDPAQRWSQAVLDHVATLAPASSVKHLRPVPSVSPVSREHPFEASVLTNQRITGRDSSKIVHHLELSLEGSGISYQPGDSLGIVATNPTEVVEPLLQALDADADSQVKIGSETLTLAEAFTSRLDITGIGRRFAQHYAEAAQRDDLQHRLAGLQGDEARAFFYDHQVVDLVREYPAAISAQSLVDGLRRLTPRLYSIASSPDANPDEVHLTVAQVQYDAFGHRHYGSTSTFLAAQDDTVEVYVEANTHFRLPEDAQAPIIMIGPGTGIAPFRAFIEHRQEHGASGDSWLFFGDRQRRSDFLYQTELQRHLKQGTLSRIDVAFSRDQAHKIYVQDRLREHASAVYDWLERGAYLYVCGDAERMAPDVHQALRDVIQQAGGKSDEQAEEYLRQLKRERRYQKDVY